MVNNILHFLCKVKEIASKVLDIAEVVYQSVIKNQAPDEPPIILQSMLLTIIAQRSSVSQLNNSNVNAVSGSFKMPSSNILLSSVENSSYIDLKVCIHIKKRFVYICDKRPVI